MFIEEYFGYSQFFSIRNKMAVCISKHTVFFPPDLCITFLLPMYILKYKLYEF